MIFEQHQNVKQVQSNIIIKLLKHIQGFFGLKGPAV